jgi:hypothetical protein
MERTLYYVSPTSDQLDWDEDGPVDKSLFVWAGDASDAVALWRKYYELDQDADPYSLGLQLKVRVHEVPIMQASSPPTAIGWDDVRTYSATSKTWVELP